MMGEIDEKSSEGWPISNLDLWAKPKAPCIFSLENEGCSSLTRTACINKSVF
jgi:hypothetical protein